MADKTHAERDWCVLPADHTGKCLADWEKKMHDKDKDFNSYRGRRLHVCRAIDDLHKAIERLGVEDGSDLPIPGKQFNPKPSEQIIAELKNQANVLLRMILIFNDGQVSSAKLNGF